MTRTRWQSNASSPPRVPDRRTWLAATIVAHLVVSIVHGAAHGGAHVLLTPAASLFVYVVILAGPVVGFGLTWWNVRLGGWIVAATMAGALVFGIVHHFVLAGPDHVAQVQGSWRALFATTAVLLAVTEALGVAMAVEMVRER
jgi:hypothetical protein